MRRVVVVGLDGFEPSIVEPLLLDGALPNLARLRARGGYARLATTQPAQTPVAWSTFAVGTNPGGHGIFDFVRRDPATYLPDLGLSRYERKNAFLPPRAVSLRRGTPLWELLSKAGIASSIIRCPCTFPPDPVRGTMLSGMGVPDLRGGLGTSTVYTTRADEETRESEKVVTVRPAGGVIATHVIGPRNPSTGADLVCPITVRLQPAQRRVAIEADGGAARLEVAEGQWSGWLRVRFPAGLLQSVRGLVRFYLTRVEPDLLLYASPVNFDPDAPLFPISAPPDFARTLARELGPFYTTGMVEDHNGLNNGRLTDDAYLRQCEEVLDERKRMMFRELERLDRGFLFCLFDTPDRVQHMFWREAGGGPGTGGLSRVIGDHYQRCDRLVGEVLERVDEDTLLIVLSDHGMKSFRRGVHLNTWLHGQGLLALRGGVGPGDGAGDLLKAVDWDRTRAYAVGLSGIYLNLKGREARGIVEPGEAPRLARAIAEGLAALGDPAHGTRPVRRVLTRAEAYAGPYAAESPDLLVNFADGYRVSWGTAHRAVPAGLIGANTRRWSRAPLIDPELVPGVLVSSRPIRTEHPRLVDLAPTILAALGVPRGDAMEGEALLG